MMATIFNISEVFLLFLCYLCLKTEIFILLMLLFHDKNNKNLSVDRVLSSCFSLFLGQNFNTFRFFMFLLFYEMNEMDLHVVCCVLSYMKHYLNYVNYYL